MTRGADVHDPEGVQKSFGQKLSWGSSLFSNLADHILRFDPLVISRTDSQPLSPVLLGIFRMAHVELLHLPLHQ